MPTAATTVKETAAFFEELRSAEERALLLDYDGTLAPFHTERLAALPYPGIAELLTSILQGRTRTRVVFITGRPALELKSLLPLFPTPEIWGSHGLERLRTDGSREIAEIPGDAAQWLGAMDRGLAADGLEAHMERKPGLIAVHWRGVGKAAARDIRARLLCVWDGLRPQQRLHLSEFDGGMEIRLGLRNKGDAVRQILAELRDATPVAYLGDDTTDEDAFKALKNRGLAVLVRNQFRPTSADAWIQPPQGVLRFLADWLHACGEEV